jgi:hypothetical protein
MSVIRTRWAAIGAAIAITLGAGGIAAVQASLSSGERAVYVPITPYRLIDTRRNHSQSESDRCHWRWRDADRRHPRHQRPLLGHPPHGPDLPGPPDRAGTNYLASVCTDADVTITGFGLKLA